MWEAKDPAIKLFGKTIPLPDISGADDSGGAAPPSFSASSSCGPSPDDGPSENRPSSPNSTSEENESNGVDEELEPGKEASVEKSFVTKEVNGGLPLTKEEFTDPGAASVVSENLSPSFIDNGAKNSKTEEQSDASNSQDKTLKKPDKILPCPRCNSMDTKFCYYNNYNVNQPRHFCKNCQRYWTAGGTMRNVPVGAGRRKNKNLASHYRHITVSEALQIVPPDLPKEMQHPTLRPNGTVLTFGSETPLCESMASALNIAEKAMQSCPMNGFRNPEESKLPLSHGSGDDVQCNSSLSPSVTAANSEVGKTGLQDDPVHNCNNFPPQLPYFPGASWPYPWNSAQWSPIPPPAFCPAGFSVPFYPAAPYWGCPAPGTWSVPWVTLSPSSRNHTCPTSGPNSPTLGKHSRDENMVQSTNSGEKEQPKEKDPEKCLWIPKTLRIDDPGEAAKSSIWATLGIRNEAADSVHGAGMFKAFQSKNDEKNHTSETSPVLQANPAAMCRSVKFHESS